MAEFTNIKINDIKYDVRDAGAARASDLAAKQDAISDLATIRSGAALGTTSVQTISVNGGTAQQPTNGVVNLTVATGGDNDLVDLSDGTANDGAVVFTKRNGDTITLNLNHTHENMAKIVKCTEATRPQTLADDTIYVQVDSANSPTEIEKLYLFGLEFTAGGGTNPVLPYDTEIEYLQSSGTQYINTGIKPTTNFKCEIKAQYVKNNNGFDTMVGCYDGTNYGVALGLQTTSGGNNLYVQFGGNTSFAASNVTTTTSLHTFFTQLSNNTLSINVDGTTNSGTYSGSLPNMNLFLFARNKATVGNFSNAKIYYCKIWNGGNLVFDAIPVRVGQVGYMYDKVSGQLFGNSGTGSFTLGNDKS